MTSHVRDSTRALVAEASASAIAHIRRQGIRLPTFKQLCEPITHIPPDQLARLRRVDPHVPDPENLFRMHWYNAPEDGGWTDVPAHIEFPRALTGVDARIVLLLGDRFPMIRTHKVLAAYACLIPRLLSGELDPTVHRAVWPSTGNYCRGGIAISRILGCRGVAVLPEGMSRERFEWLEKWVTHPDDIIRTPGTESNVKEIYDKCAELASDDRNIILNQFSEYGNYLVHRECTGRAASRVFEHLAGRSSAELAGFVAATGSAGTLGAGDYLKRVHGSMTVAVEAIECPTLLRNGFGEHNIQGIGDKHVPLIHNVMSTDVVVGVSERSCDAIHVLFNTPIGHEYLTSRRDVPSKVLHQLSSLGLSSIANLVASIKLARHFDLGGDHVVLSVATDDASLYLSQIPRLIASRFGGDFDSIRAAEIFGEHLAGLGHCELLHLTHTDRLRVFNLGYYTWVEQRGVSVEHFEERRSQSFWTRLGANMAAWDNAIEDLNLRTHSD